MAFDKSGTRNRVILTVVAGSVVFLILLKFVLDSYFIAMTEQVKAEKLASPEALIQLHESERKALETGGSMPLDQALSRLAQGREGAGAGVAPRQSDDINAMKGWAQMPKAFNTAAPIVAAAPEPAPAPSAAPSASAAPAAPTAPAIPVPPAPGH